MNEFTPVLKDFRRGHRSLEDLLAAIEQSINDHGIQPSDILARLTDENARDPLPHQALAAIRQHIAASSNSQRMNTQPMDMDDTVGDADTVIEDDELPVPALLADEQQLLPASDHPTDHTITDFPLPKDTRDTSNNLVGTTLNDRYELESLVGSGGMGTVYRAIDRERLKSGFSNPYVAIKILHRRLSLRQDWYSRFQQEASRCQQLTHPNIVEVYGFNSDGPNVYLSMEYLEGETLKQKIHHHGTEGLPYRDAARIITAMGEALAHAHDHGIVHYDFKPNNVFVTDGGRVKVIDFGIARMIDGEQQSDHIPSGRKTLTPVYASPQMLEHQAPDPRDDIFAFAMTCYEVLTGRHPFARKLATKARDAGLCPMAPEELSRQQWELLNQSLAFNRDHRTATISDYLQKFNAHKHPSQQDSAVVKWVAASIVLLLAVTAFYLVGGWKIPIEATALTFDSLPAHTKSDEGKGKQLLSPGFADTRSKYKINLSLSQARARSVARQLAWSGGREILTEGFGKEVPAACSNTKTGFDKTAALRLGSNNLLFRKKGVESDGGYEHFAKISAHSTTRRTTSTILGT
ncbi:MAG: protein kinase [Pseudomonadota bacterium]